MAAFNFSMAPLERKIFISFQSVKFTKVKDSLSMLLNFLKNPKETGAIAVSSKYLTNEIIKNIDFKNSRCIVELGSGLGTVTKSILRNANPNAKVVCFEINERFCAHISKNCFDRRLIVINADAGKIREKLNELQLSKADCIVSCLPFINLSKAKRKKIISGAKDALKEGGRFILYQYSNNLGKMLDLHFSKVKRTFVPFNLPPCFVYVCEN